METLLLLSALAAFAFIGGFTILSKSLSGVQKTGTILAESYNEDVSDFIDEKKVQQIKKKNKNKSDLIAIMAESPASDETFDELYKRLTTKSE